MKHYLLSLLIIIIFLSGCITQQKTEPVSSVGLSRVLSSETKTAKTSMPITFMLTVKNLASESATGVTAELLNLTGWSVEDSIQDLEELLPDDSFKFSWIGYAPSTPNITFTPVANVFYKMESNAKINLRVYDNVYLNTLKPEERNSIKEKSALLSSAISKNTQISVKISIQQPFILTEHSQRFPFVIEVRNAGLGKVFRDDTAYPPGESLANYFRFSYTSNSTITCDFEDEWVRLENGNKNIACRLSATEDDLDNYADFPVDFTIAYTYLDRASTRIEVA